MQNTKTYLCPLQRTHNTVGQTLTIITIMADAPTWQTLHTTASYAGLYLNFI